MSVPSSDEQGPHYDERLRNAYTKTEYRFQDYPLRIGHLHPEFDAWLEAHQYHNYAFVTPYNPHSKPLPEPENKARLHQLHHLLLLGNLTFAPAVGHDPDAVWPDEIGVFIFDLSPAEVHEIGRAFGQNAVVEGKVGGVPLLVWL